MKINRTMNILKSFFISLYMMAAMAITAFAVRSLLTTNDYITWVGVILATAPFLLVLSWLMILRSTARTSARLPSVIVLGVVGVIAATWGYAQGGSVVAPVLALTSFVAYLAYAYWYSSFGRSASSQLEIGNTLPGFELQDIAGHSITSSSLTNKPTIWIFYRGNWCPLCMAQIRELAGQYQQLEAMGVRVALISPQPHKFTVGLAKKFDVAFDFLTDKDNRAALTLGIANPNGLPMGMQVLGYASDTVMPTVIITEVGGRILWVHETDNYRIRPEPEVYLAVLSDLSTKAHT